MKTREFVFALFISLACIPIYAQRLSLETERTLMRLDSLLDQMGNIHSQKEARIAELKRASLKSNKIDDVLWYNENLYNEYFVYNTDSAMHYINKNMELYKKNGYQEQVINVQLDRSLLYVNTGLLDHAKALIDSIQPYIKESQKSFFYDVYRTYLDRRSRYNMTENLSDAKQFKKLSASYTDSIMKYITPADPQYLWYKTWEVLGKNKGLEELISQLEKLSKSNPLLTRNDAMVEYALARLYRATGNPDKEVYHMARAGIADLTYCNQDVASVNELATWFYEHGRLERAYRYAGVAMSLAYSYGDRVRMTELGVLISKISENYVSEKKKQENKQIAIIILLSTMTVLLIGNTGWLHINRKKRHTAERELKRNMEELEKANLQLTLSNQELEKAHQELQKLHNQLQGSNITLQESVEERQNYITQVLSMCSNYINKLDEFRIDINRKIKGKKFNEIEELTSSQAMSQEQIQKFYQTFDAIFLSIFPNFVQDFNKLMQPEHQVLPQKGEKLSTELRILALIKLGITDSVRISEFLHCSNQTVYNYRLRIRNNSLYPEKKVLIQAIQQL